jgi:hypothetical protein
LTLKSYIVIFIRRNMLLQLLSHFTRIKVETVERNNEATGGADMNCYGYSLYENVLALKSRRGFTGMEVKQPLVLMALHEAIVCSQSQQIHGALVQESSAPVAEGTESKDVVPTAKPRRGRPPKVKETSSHSAISSNNSVVVDTSVTSGALQQRAMHQSTWTQMPAARSNLSVSQMMRDAPISAAVNVALKCATQEASFEEVLSWLETAAPCSGVSAAMTCL